MKKTLMMAMMTTVLMFTVMVKAEPKVTLPATERTEVNFCQYVTESAASSIFMEGAMGHASENLFDGIFETPWGLNSPTGWIEFVLKVGKLRAVDVRHAVKAHARTPVWPQSAACHHRAEIGPADADIDNVAERPMSMAAELPRVHRLDELLDRRQRFPDLDDTWRLEADLVGEF